MNAAAIQRLVPELFRVIAELEAAAPGRHFTPDGHLIGCIGEVIAADRYGLTLTTPPKKRWLFWDFSMKKILLLLLVVIGVRILIETTMTLVK